MKGPHAMYGLLFLLILAVQPFAVSQQVASQPQAGYQVLHEFHGSPDGAEPFPELVRDPAGNEHFLLSVPDVTTRKRIRR